MPGQIQGPFLGKGHICEAILRGLPEWFGIEEAVCQYGMDIDSLPTLLAVVDEQVVGFLTLKYHTAYAAEIYVMGLVSHVHRQGLGRALVEQAESLLRRAQIEYLQVKTLAPSVTEEHYARTRAFYLAMGFRPIEEFKQIWDEANPCWLMVKYLGKREDG
jgi:GNAT superfamily N-acetyltransferase